MNQNVSIELFQSDNESLKIASDHSVKISRNLLPRWRSRNVLIYSLNMIYVLSYQVSFYIMKYKVEIAIRGL